MKALGYNKALLWLTIFSIAMGLLESAVVIYVREIYYPNGFEFPVVLFDKHIAITELLREMATIIMLLGIAVIAGRNVIERFAWFIYCFAVWDIFYYVFLKLILDWPESFFTYDVLFLVPVMWVGPVITPLIVSFTMILLAIAIVKFAKKRNKVNFHRLDWILLIFGSIIIITGFIWDYCKFVIRDFTFNDIWFLPFKETSITVMSLYYPYSFNWFIFITGEVIILTAILFIYLRNSKA